MLCITVLSLNACKLLGDLIYLFCHSVVANHRQINLQQPGPLEDAFGFGLPPGNGPSLLEMSQNIQVASSTHSPHGIQQ